jgi:hypothetical protein
MNIEHSDLCSASSPGRIAGYRPLAAELSAGFTGLVLDHEIAPAAKSSFAATHALRAATRPPRRRVTHLDSEPKFRAYLAAFREGLQKLGWTEGRNIGIEGAPT